MHVSPSSAVRSSRFSLAVLLALTFAVSLLVLVVPGAEAAGNKPPRLTAISTKTVSAGQVLTVRPKASDPDSGPKKLRFSATRPTWLKLNAKSGMLKGRAPVSAGGRHWRVTLRVTDGQATVARTFTVRVKANQAPRLAAISNRNVRVTDDLIIRPVASDPDRGPRALRYSVAYSALNGSPARPDWLGFNQTTGYLIGTPPASAAGDKWRVVVTVSDGDKSARRAFYLTVLPPETTNHAPQVDAQSFNVAENSVGATVGQVTGSDSDGDTLTWALTSSGMPFAITADGTITTTAALDFETKKTYQLTVRASDGTDSTDAEVTVHVTDVDESPVIAAIDDVTSPEDAAITPITVTAEDPEGEDVTVTVAGLPTGLTYNATTKTISGTPTAVGAFAVTVTATDGTSAAAVATFTLTVTGANHAPVIADQTFSVEENAAPGTEVGTVEATDQDGDDLTFSSDSTEFDVAADGTVTVSGADLSDGNGPFTVEVSVTDGTTTADATITINLVDVDNAPSIEDQAFSVAEDAAPGTEVGTVDATDADGDTITYAITGGNADGAFAIDAGSGAIAVAGPLDFETKPAHALTVTASAGTKSAAATVTITVTDVNEAPGVTEIADRTGTEDQPIDPIAVEVTDPDQGDTVTVTVDGLPAGLTYAAGQISGTPTVPGDFDVVVSATDAGGLTGTTGFTLTVSNVNDAPVITPIDDVTATEGEAIDPIIVTATDEDGDDVVLSTSALPAGLTWDAASATISGTATESGDFSITVTADDGNGGTDTETFQLSVANVNDAPVIVSVTPASVSGTVGQPVDTVLTVVVTDEDGDDVTLDVTGLPAGLSATDNGDGTITVSGTPTSAGDTTATVTATDPDDASDTADLTVSIAAAAPACTPRSTLTCAEVPVDLPYSLTFNGTEGGLGNTGFTMVDPPSARSNVDQAPAPATPSVPTVPGYEPGLVSTSGGNLAMTATKGIMYRKPADSAGTNSQLNALGVGVSGGTNGYEVETTLVAPTFSSSGAASSTGSQQGGVWFGLGEDDYVKAAVVRVTSTTNKVQLVTETGAVATPSTTNELNSTPFPAGQDVHLVLRAEDAPGDGGTVSVKYTVNGGALTQLTDAANTVNSSALPIPQKIFSGVSLSGAGAASFAGLYTTKRGAAATDNVVVPFGDFNVHAIASAADLHEKYSFTTTADTAVPAGYTKNNGAAWTDASGIGWVTQASLAGATHTPLDLTTNTRVRTRPAPVTALQNRMIHLQYGDVDGGTGTSGNKTAGAFERAVPNGWYQVTVSVGDQMGATAYDSQHTVNIEGVNAINRFQATAAQEYATATVTAQVTDGRLTMDAIGGTNTKVNYLEIDSTTAPVESDLHQKVRFADEATAPPAGYLKDFGQAYGARVGTDQGTGQTYGWESIATKLPISLVGNGRNRLTTTPAAPAGTTALHAGLLHMQLPANAASGVTTPGYWEMAVPNGTYTVSVSTGDATAVDSDAWLNIEDQNAIAHFVPTGADGAASHWMEATRTVAVSDGRLTIAPTGGTNTKINWVTIDSVAGAATRPSVRTPNPANLATGVDPATTSVVSDLRLPNGGVEGTSLTAASVRLTRVSDGVQIPAGAATSGGSDTINLSPTQALDPNTLYRFELTSGATDITGAHFLPYSIVFTTGTGTSTGGPVAFDKVDAGAPKGALYTSLVKGPDGKMYAGSITGQIYRFDIAADGSLTNRQTISTVQTYSSTHDTYNPGTRTVIGMAFDPASTAANPILWITDDAPFLGTQDVPQFSGRVAKLSGANLGTYQAILTGLPRSVKDHETNSAAFGPDGALYFNQGADNAMGRADGTWRNRPETLLSAAVLRLDPSKLPAAASLPVDIQTEAFDDADGDVTGSNGPKKNSGPYYSPYASGAPLTIYAHGIRNAFDLVWHSNGHLYTPTNGSAAGGNTPAVPSPLPASCAQRPDGGYTGGAAPAITNNPDAETDYIFDIKQGGYYGHPNPARCEYVLAGGNPTSGKDPFEVPSYPVGTQPDPNLDLTDIYDAGLHASANGAVEYKGGAFGGALNGKLLYVRYSSGQDVVSFDVNQSTGRLSNRTSIVTGLAQPLDIAEDNATGNLYVTQLTDNGANTSIALLKPQGGGGGPVATATDRLVFSGVSGQSSANQNAVVKNTGIDPVTVTGATLGGTDGGQFALPSSPPFPITVAAGASVSIPVRFSPSSTGVKAAALSVATSAGTKSVTLRGLGAAGLGGSNEPSLQRILDTWQIPVNVGDPNPADNALPTTNPLGDEVPAQLFAKAADDSPISITPIAGYGPQDNDPAIKVGWYDAGNAAGTHQQFTVKAADAQGLAISPVGTTTNIDPGSGIFGIYSQWPYFGDRKVFTEDALNGFDSAMAHHVRAYQMKNADGSVVPDTYLLATEETTGTPDYQDVVLIVSNVKPAVPAATNAVLKIANPDPAPFADQVSFSRIQTTADANQKVADTGVVRISNTGTEAMQVTGINLTDTFALDNAPTLPFTLAPGATRDVTVRFTATATKVHNGTLTVQSNAGNGPQSVRLGGLWQSVSEGGQEPTVVQIARAAGIGTNIPTDLNSDGHVEAVGDEVLSPYWFRSDTTKPVTVRQLSAYHTYPNGATIFRHDKGSNSTTSITNINTAWAQSLLPPKGGSTTLPAFGSWTPGATAFGFQVDGEWSDPTKNSHTADVANGCVEPCGHHVRIFPVEDRDGVRVPGSYLLIMDYSGINYDYNDNTYLITNIRPELLQTPQGVSAVAGDGKATISWSPTGEAGVKYRVYRGTSPTVAVGGTGAAAATEVTPTGSTGAITATSFTDTGLTNGTTYYYLVRAVIPGSSNSSSTPAVAVTPNLASAFAQKVNFQSAAAPVPAGYLRDYGQAFGARTGADQGSGLSFGWLSQAGRQPLDLSVGGTTNVGNGRDRDLETDQRLDTFMHMQAEDVPNFNGTVANGVWEIAVPDGQYAVTVAVGDGAANTDPERHRLNVEGTTAIAGFVPTGAAGTATHHATATVTVTVSDGRLTLDAVGGSNSKLDYVDIAAVG